MKDRFEFWGTAWGRVTAAFIVLAVFFAIVVAATLFGLYGNKVVTVSDFELLGADVQQNGNAATETLRISLNSGRQISGYDSRVEDDCMFLTFYSAIRGNYPVDNKGVTTFVLTTDKKINYIRMEDGKDKKDLVRITWREPVAAQDVRYHKNTLSGNTLELSLKLNNKKLHICDFTSRTEGERLYISVNAAPIVTEYQPDSNKAYTLSLPVTEDIKSVWVEDSTGEKLALCDVSWPSVASKEDFRLSTPRIIYETTLGFVSLDVDFSEGLYLWEYTTRTDSEGVMYLKLRHNTVQGDYRENDDGTFNIGFEIGNNVKELRVEYSDGSTEPIFSPDWPTPIELERIASWKGIAENNSNATDIVFKVAFDEGVYYHDKAVRYEGNSAYVTFYSQATAMKPDDKGFYTVKVRLKEETDFVVFTYNSNEQIAFKTAEKRLLEAEEIKLDSHNVTNGKLTLKLELNKQNYYLTKVNAIADADRLVVSFYASATEGDLAVDADGLYTVELDLPDEIETVIQEVAGNEATLIEKISA